MTMPNLSVSAGGGGPSGSSSNARTDGQLATPFNFDHSGWVVNLHSGGAVTTASGNRDANGSSQAGSSGLLPTGMMMPLLILAAVLLLSGKVRLS